MLDHWPAAARWLAAGSYWQMIPSSSRQKSRLRRWKRFVEGFSQSPARRYLEWISIFGEARRAGSIVTSIWPAYRMPTRWSFLARRLCAVAWPRRRDRGEPGRSCDLFALRLDDQGRYGIDGLWAGCRQPFLDHRVVELAARMPLCEKFRWGRGKRILLETFADLLPLAIRRRRKMGFGVPLDHWFRMKCGILRGMFFSIRKRNPAGSFGPRRCSSFSTITCPAVPTTANGYGRC